MTNLHVVVPSFNAMDWLPRCLDSIAAQTYPAASVTVVDDASTDPAQAPFIADYCERRPTWRAVLNPENLEAAHNIWNAHLAIDPDPDDVIVEVDGDDALAHDQALARIATEYDDPETWMTYGSYAYYPDPNHWDNPALPYPAEVIAARSYRRHSVYFNHPETWRAFLWERLGAWELQDERGQWIRRTWDYAAMMPLLELAGSHWRWIPDVLYLYTHGNPGSHVRSPEHQAQAQHEAEVVRNRPPREPIPDDHVANPRRKRDMIVGLARKHEVERLVETGTGMGDLLHWCWRHFRQSWSIEYDETSFNHCAARFASAGDRVRLWHGDSATEVPYLVDNLAEPAVWFLDAHWSGGSGQRPPKDTPVVSELTAILASPVPHIVVIDDARLFSADNTEYQGYPTFAEIRAMAPMHRASLIDDMIILEPSR